MPAMNIPAISRAAIAAFCLCGLAACGSDAGPTGVEPPPGSTDLGVNASLNGRVPFPSDNAWNLRIDTASVDPASDLLIASIGLNTSLHPDWGTTETYYGIPYIVVAGSTPKVSVAFDYADESDAGPYPIPANAPIEGGAGSSGDRHILIIDRDNWILYELYAAYPPSGGQGWRAGSGAIFDLNSNALRPAGWTSADAAGLPIFPGLARYDEVAAGAINHALRFTAAQTRQAYVHPARHWASSSTDPARPPMGMRVRLKSTFDTSGYPHDARVVLDALKKYGMILADNGSNWYVSGVSDTRWDPAIFDAFRNVKGSDFEVVRMGTVVTP
ncbi:MAG TPA: hypothetical protein PKA66_12645 [Gemmatimonadales bacterium]|nr:hypothetical protein [Gemmatimonadales bacterium]